MNNEKEDYLLFNDDWVALAEEAKKIFGEYLEKKLQNGEKLSDKDKLTAEQYGIELS